METQQILQEIQEKIGTKRINEWLETVTDVWYWQHTYSINKWEYQEWYYPISLSRVLSALGEWFWCIDGFIWNMKKPINLCKRKLITDTWSDAMLDDQSDHTIKAIWEIVCK